MALFRIERFQRILIYIFIFILIIFLFMAGKRGIADVYAYQARAFMDHWGEKNINPSTRQWESAMKSLSHSLDLLPNNPVYLESMAELYQWQVLSPEMSQNQSTEALNMSKQFFRKAIALRPVWPYAWANYALVKQQLHELDDEYQHALERAIKLGAWEPKVQQILAHATLPNWHMLKKTTQQLTLDNTFRALHSQFHAFTQIAKQYNMLSTLCTKLQRDDAVKLACSDKYFR